MRIRIVLSHPASYLFGETREAIIAESLLQLGHDVQIFRVQHRPEPRREQFGAGVTVRYFVADDPAARPHDTVSEGLFAALAEDAPEVLIFKGIGYRIVDRALDRVAPGAAQIGFILGGSAKDPVLARADFVLTESEGQIAEAAAVAGRPLRCAILAKYIDWATADRLFGERQQAGADDHDIVNVGSFERRKNQIGLQPFFGRYRLAFVGTGETLAHVTEAAAGYPDISFYGALPNPQTLAVVARARLMVHASVWEGVPRAALEALACGTPVLAHDFAIQERFAGTTAVRLVAEGALVPAAEALLADPPLLAAMAADGRRYAWERHGPHRLAEAAGRILAFSGAA